MLNKHNTLSMDHNNDGGSSLSIQVLLSIGTWFLHWWSSATQEEITFALAVAASSFTILNGAHSFVLKIMRTTTAIYRFFKTLKRK